MDKQEAIERLKQNKAAAEFYAEMIGNYRSAENELKDIEAFDVAIESLQKDIERKGDLISRYDVKDKVKEIIYSILDDTDYNDIESMANACLMMKIKILKMFDEFPSADVVSHEEYEELYRKAKEINEMANDILANFPMNIGGSRVFEPVDNKLYLNPVCRNCKHSSYCNNIPR